MTQAAIRPGSPSLFRWRPWGWLALASLLLAGCAQTQQGTPAQPRAGVEPVTESDEPPERRRARIRLELATSYFEQGQTTVALDEIKLSLAADPTYASAYMLRGLVYSRMNELPLAEESFRRAQPRVQQKVARDGGIGEAQDRAEASRHRLLRRPLNSPSR